jgi:hypothetical protein
MIAKHERADWTEVQELSQTERGEGGFYCKVNLLSPVREIKLVLKK